MSSPTVQHISDTARWAAVYRARETERKNPLFRDLFARRLAGERGEQIARATPFHEKHSWSWITRTYLFDRIIREQVAQGADLVVNLAAGLDARPYRMQLPEQLKWVEVDLPQILDYKEELLKAEKPTCTLERVRADLSDAGTRRSLLGRLAGGSTKALVVNGRTLDLPAVGSGGGARRRLKQFPCVQTVGSGHRIAETAAHVAEEHSSVVQLGRPSAAVCSRGWSRLLYPARLESYRSPLDAENGCEAEPPYVGHAIVGAPAGEPEQERLALVVGCLPAQFRTELALSRDSQELVSHGI